MLSTVEDLGERRARVNVAATLVRSAGVAMVESARTEKPERPLREKPPDFLFRSLGRSAVALLLAWAAGCTEGGGDPGPGPSASTERLAAGSPCATTEECRAGLLCHPERRICICTSDANCPGLQCDPFSGRCVREPEGCRQDSDCGGGQRCDTSARICRPVRGFCESCEEHADCGEGNRCLRSAAGLLFCGAACSTAADCPRPRTDCVSGQCVPQVDCRDVAPCLPDSLRRCGADSDCAADQVCGAAGLCVARNSGCAAGQRCDPQTRECYDSCDGDEECASHEQCRQGRCVALPPCTSDADCPRPRICAIEPAAREGRCVVGCSGDAACPLESVCNQRDGRPVCEPGCNTDSDCLLDRVCENGLCVPGRCQSSDACPTCQRCEQGRCVAAVVPGDPATAYCAPCSSPRDPVCGPGGLCIDGRCAPSCPADGCPRGFSCGPARLGAGEEPVPVCFPNDSICDTECL